MNMMAGTIVKDELQNEYIVEEAIGEGGFANVFRIRRMSDETLWALKSISNIRDEISLKSFKNEGNLATKIESDNVIKYVFIHDGEMYKEYPPYIIMEYADGGTLKKLIEDCKQKNIFFSNESIKSFCSQLISGMKAVNEILVHRDIKPENILIDKGKIKISDFGLAKVSDSRTRTSTFKGFGTLKYIAPEGWANDKNTVQMDIYSMGIVFYEIATLQYPYKINNPWDVSEWKEAHLFSEPINPLTINNKLSPTISSVIMKMLAKETSRRFKNWEEIQQYFQNDEIENADYANIIKNMVATRISADSAESKKILEEEKKRKNEEDLCKIIKYQVKRDIYNPLNEFINDFNKSYPQGRIAISESSNIDKIDIIIRLISNKKIEIKLIPILESNFIRNVKYRDFGEVFSRTELVLPEYRNRKIKAWGGMYSDDGTGFNILLLENENDIYGEWKIVQNRNSGLVSSYRTEPFAFELNELEKEVPLIHVMSRYNSNVEEFDIKKLFEYIAMKNF